VNLIFGAVIDPNIGDELRITVIATGFERSSGIGRIDRRARSRIEAQGGLSRMEVAPEQFVVSDFDSSNLDIPAFLRRR